ncbi:MAG: hypothetical protein RL338_1128 [Chloroflexota bacterium]
MQRRQRRIRPATLPARIAAAIAAGALALAACGGGPTPAPTSPATASPAPTATEAAYACPVERATLEVPSNRLVAVEVVPREGRDAVVFTFGPSGEGSGATPTVEIATAEPPFVKAPSGFPLEVAGDAYIRLTFRETIVYDESGTGTLGTPNELAPLGAAVREVVEAEAFEGVADWLVGVAGDGCARVAVDPDAGTLVLEVRAP